MRIPPHYKITPEIVRLISRIHANTILFSSIAIPKQLKEKIHRVSTLKSSLFSARIEGNELTMDEFETSSDTRQKLEVFNILAAMEYIDQVVTSKQDISKKLIIAIHSIVMKGISSDAGHIRTDVSAIFNQAGVAVYMTPPPSHIQKLLEKLLLYINTSDDSYPLITAMIAHIIFEKIHPFIDGNGRVGRLLIYAILKSRDPDCPLCIPFEEQLETQKQSYYYYMDCGLEETEDYLLFMLSAFYTQTEKVKDFIFNQMSHKKTLLLPPRQEELYTIIKEHETVSFDFLHRRFLKIPERTLRFDLKKLQEKGIIIKIGNTKGSFYTVQNNQ